MEPGEILIRRGLLDQRQLEISRSSIQDGASLVDTAVELGFVREDEALRALADEVGLDYVDLSETEVDLSLLKDFPHKLIHRQSLFPISRHNGELVVATCDPFDLYPIDEVSAVTGLSVTPVLAGRNEIAKLIKRHLGVGSETVDGLMLATAEEDGIELLSAIETDGSELSEMAQEASVVRLVNEILLEALESRASDVHIETQPSGLKIRYRIDGMLQTQPVPPEINRFALAIVSRLKIMARLNIAEKRLPQDGRMKLRISGREVDVRVSVIPMIHGEGMVMRLLDKSSMSFDLKGLGMEDETYDTFRKLIDIPHGIILVTGPTGSGKTTTLYTSLKQLATPEVNVCTIEDPIELVEPSFNQMQVQHNIGLDFASGVKTLLRQDPDIIMVGEIRDRETAEMAVQAALTGHLVLSTLHTNDAPSAIARLTEIGVPHYLITATLIGVVAQRLVRTLCPHCKHETSFDLNDWQALIKPWTTSPPDKIAAAEGCLECRQTGFIGRVGIYEMMPLVDALKQEINENFDLVKFRKAAIRQGMKPLNLAGAQKVARGMTTIEEVLKVAPPRYDG